MTIQRQYNLPNCTLLLEGISKQGMFQPEARPVMDILTRVECRFPGLEKPLTGGKEFFESLVKEVSLYAQEFLSGIHLPQPARFTAPGIITMQKVASNQHRINIEATETDASGYTNPKTVDLTTLQLFDLVDAIDQFVADTQTLPFWALTLAPVSSRFVRQGEPIAKQAVPAAIGVSGLALAGLALLALPVPQVKLPDHLKISAAPATTASPSPTPSPTASPSPTVAPSAEATPSAAPSPTAAAAPAAPDLAKLESTLSTAPEITDPKDLETLGRQLKTKINEKLTGKTFAQELIYRVGVAKNGDILGYKPANEAANERIQDTPLAGLQYYVPPSETRPQEPIAQFKVTFPPKGAVMIEPWTKPAATAPSVPAAEDGTPPGEILETSQLKELQPKLYDQVNEQWSDRQAPPEDAMFRVRVKADGTIFDYEPINPAARDFAPSTPLPQLGPAVEPNTPVTEPLASFKVVFTTNEVLQVSSWYGRR
jgi:Domain of unknown function (DUF4335)